MKGEMKTIFTVTALQPPYNTRVVGWFLTLEDAKNSVINNHCDIWEYSYMHAVIEEVRWGFYPCPPDKTYWFRFNKKLGKYEEITQPSFYKNITNFGIG